MPDTAKPKEVQFANVTIVRDEDGKLNAFVGADKILGVNSINMTPLQDGSVFWAINIMGNRVRIAERTPVAPAYEYKDNVVPFKPVPGSAGDVPQSA
jgi:hypothetical protein